MNKRIHIYYSWKDRGEERWLFWLRKKLEKLGLDVELSSLSNIPSADLWLESLEQTLVVSTTHIVTHDPGCLTLLSYITKLVENKFEGRVLLVAGQSRFEPALVRALLSESKTVVGERMRPQKNSADAAHAKSNQRELLIASKLKPKLIVVFDGTAKPEIALSNVLSRLMLQ